jgi:hypothetical protein
MVSSTRTPTLTPSTSPHNREEQENGELDEPVGDDDDDNYSDDDEDDDDDEYDEEENDDDDDDEDDDEADDAKDVSRTNGAIASKKGGAAGDSHSGVPSKPRSTRTGEDETLESAVIPAGHSAWHYDGGLDQLRRDNELRKRRLEDEQVASDSTNVVGPDSIIPSLTSPAAPTATIKITHTNEMSPHAALADPSTSAAPILAQESVCVFPQF